MMKMVKREQNFSEWTLLIATSPISSNLIRLLCLGSSRKISSQDKRESIRGPKRLRKTKKKIMVLNRKH